MTSNSRRLFALALLGAAVAPVVARAADEEGGTDLMRKLRGAPGARVGGATRGIHRDDQATNTPAPAAGRQAAPQAAGGNTPNR